jgi:hypothetical protein
MKYSQIKPLLWHSQGLLVLCKQMCQVYGNTYLVELLTDYSSMLCVPSNYKHTTAMLQLDTDLGYGM